MKSQDYNLKLFSERLPHSALGPHSLEKQSGGPHTHTLGHFRSPVAICHWTIEHCSSALPVITKYVMGPINANSFCNPEPSQDSWVFLNILQFILSGPGDWRKSVWRAFMDPEETGMEDSRVFFWSPFGFIRTVLWKKYDFFQSPGGLTGQQATKKDPVFPILVPQDSIPCSASAGASGLILKVRHLDKGMRFSLGTKELIFGKRKYTVQID